jgi:predicted HTH transcriptional regulator
MIQNKVNKDLQFSVLKTIAAFLNSDGGTIIIGVDDNQHVCGLERDLQTLSKPKPDVFEQTLMNLLVEHIGVEFSQFVRLRFENPEGQIVCVVEVNPGSGPAYLSSPRGKEFYIRAGNTTRSLDTEEAISYINMHWQ